MGRSKSLPLALLASGALLAMIASPGAAQDAEPLLANDIEISVLDPASMDGVGINVSLSEDGERFELAGAGMEGQPRRLQLEIAAGGAGAPLEVSLIQSRTLGDDKGGGSELRIGRGLVARPNGAANDRSVYVYVASENEALTWQPGARSEFGGQGSALALQERVEVGDLSAGVTYEQGGVQASLAYVERDASTQVGQQSFSQDESFTGVTVTMRR
jgi:hypothetical protein